VQGICAAQHSTSNQAEPDNGLCIHILLQLVSAPGNCSDHWRKNTPELGQRFRAYSIDLLGYGFSDKPDPKQAPSNSIYNFDNWGQQLVDFTEQVIGAPAYISCNSVGGACGWRGV
jgi:pimeloyl-ACP methyl ester carboxylesterase